MRVADMKARELGNAERAMKDFVHLVGPVINGYAFCDIEKQKTIAKDALKWTIDHPVHRAARSHDSRAARATARTTSARPSTSSWARLAKEEAYLDEHAERRVR